jgi:hypothetical protein
MTGWIAVPESARLADIGLDLAGVLRLIAEAERVGAGRPHDGAVYHAETVGQLVDALQATPSVPRPVPWRENPDAEESP